MSNSLIAVVTGTNSGIGFQIVQQLLASAKPYIVYCGARSLEKSKSGIQKAQEATKGSGQTRLLPLVLDVDSDESILSAVKEIGKEHDHVDILINNAGERSSSHSYDEGQHLD